MKPYLDSDQLRNRLKLRCFKSEKELLKNHPTVASFFASGALAGSLLISSHTGTLPPPTTVTAKTISVADPLKLQPNLTESLNNILPKQVQNLNPDQEMKISEAIKDTFGINATAILEGNKLNDSYGKMGAEQHLARFPGDSVENMAPGLGGWGYVPEDMEKYYVAVQTLYLPNWKTDTKKLAKWYKFRKVVVVNPANGKTIIASIADAGPADWTGKKFGGSPEVMAYLGINYGMQNHPVILFFLDDKTNTIPLGPLDQKLTYNKELWQKFSTTI